MAFAGYTIFRDNVFNTSAHMVFEAKDENNRNDIVKTLMKSNKIGDVISVFEEDTEDDGYLIASWFNDSYRGWVDQYSKTDVELTILETNGFFDC